MSHDFITEIANILNTFFKGLTDCHVLTRYTVQLQITELDRQIIEKIKSLIQALIKNLERICYNTPVIPQRERSTKTVVNTVLPVHNNHLDSKEQNDIRLGDPVSLTAAPTQFHLVEGMPSNTTNIIDRFPDYFKIKDNSENDEEKTNYKLNLPENKMDTYTIPKFHLKANNVDCTVIPYSVREMKKKEHNYFVKSYSLSSPLMKNNVTRINDNTCKENERKISEENNLSLKPSMLQTLSKSKLQKNKAAENIVHIIVETIDRTINLNASDNKIRMTNDGNNYIKSNDIATSKDDVKNDLPLNIQSSLIDKQELITTKEKIHIQPQNNGFGTFACSSCCKTYTTFQALKKHNAESHSSNQKQYKCIVCNKIFVTKLGLTRHADSHGRKKTAFCAVCGKSFRRSDYLQTHSKIHLGKKKFACNICPKEFILKTQLKHHEKIHSDIKDFVCDICNKGFSRKDKLKEHILRHLNIKKFQCSTCNKCYAENRDLKRHLKSHMKAK